LTAPERISGSAPGFESQGLAQLTAVQATEAIRAGEITSEELVTACLARIDEVEGTVRAWTHLDADYALEQARAADAARREGKPLGALHGVPVGIKDIFDTADMPTEYGTPIRAGHKPLRDSTAVARLRQAGAVVMGKTVTTEFALYTPGETRNPNDPERTPGGSSSGSAAAVAAGMVPLAIGSQTHGSVIRPASFCGVCGYKPTHGLISRHGVLRLSRALDQMGVFSRSLEDLAVMAECLMGYDENDPDTRPQAVPALFETVRTEPPLTPRLAFVKQPAWAEAEADVEQAFAELVDHLGEQVVAEVDLPPAFADAYARHGAIMEADVAKNLGPAYVRAEDAFSQRLREIVERGRKVTAVDYTQALDEVGVLNEYLGEVFAEFDAILTPATTGEAPAGLESTGNPVFCTIWTLCGTPAISLPVFEGSHGMPIGAQLVGGRGDDARLLRTARWLMNQIAE